MKRSTKNLVTLSVLTALYVVLSAMFKVSLGIGNIALDLGYIAFTVALCQFGVWGTIVGVVGCMLESILFTAYGFSISWATANLIIGLGCGLVFTHTSNSWIKLAAIFGFCAIGLLGAKTIIECTLYSIPYAVKIPKNAVAFGADTIVMIGGLWMNDRLKKPDIFYEE